jgi:uncharacterized protein YndB with AHSA1/START domain
VKITVETMIPAPMERIWRMWSTPKDIMAWNAASEDWHCPAAEIDLREGGRFSYRMEARDGNEGFDFSGVFTKVIPQEVVEYRMDDRRSASVRFLEGAEGVTVRITFDAESVYPVEMQQAGWQAILDNFARHVQAAR